LLGAFFLLYEPWNLGLKDFFRQEGFYAVLAQEIDSKLPICTAHGTAVRNTFPLFPVTVQLLTRWTGMEMVFVMRLLSVFMTFVTGILVLISVWRARDFTAAAVAAAMFWSSNIVLEKSWDGYPSTTVMFGLLAAQLVWLYLGSRKNNWNLAWVASCVILALTFYAGGFYVFFLFFLPMIFLRRPLTLWPKLAMPGMLIGLAVLGAVIVLWDLPFHLLPANTPVQRWWPEWQKWDYLENLLHFPVDVVVRFTPWIILAWAPFCVALQALDPTPLFSKYLRAITLTTLVFLWLSPETESYDLIYLAAPFSMLCGMYYESAVMRYAPRLRFLTGYGGGIFILGTALGILFFCTSPESLIAVFVSLHESIAFREILTYRTMALAVGSILLVAAGFVYWGPSRKPVWTCLLLAVLSAVSFFHLVMFPYRIQNQDHREMAKLLARKLEQDRKNHSSPAKIFKLNISDLYSECSLLNARVRKISVLDELPMREDVIYLVSTEFPQLPDRIWTNLLAQDQTYRGRRICLWKGVLRKEEENISR